MPNSSLWKEGCLSKRTEDHEYLLVEAEDSERTHPVNSMSQEPLTKYRSLLGDLFLLQAPCLCFLFLILSGVLIGCGILIGRNLPSTRDLRKPNITYGEYEQKWSPILEEVDSSYRLVQFNGSLMRENVFRLPAGPEVDAAWESLGVNYRALAVPESQAAKAGLRPSQVQINASYGGGYPANVEGLHHLHCLNLLRQALYYNIDYYRSAGKGAFSNSEVIVRHHVSHCLDILRQQLMCTPNTALMGRVWWDRKAPKPFVDFNTDHKCRDYDSIREWAEKRQLPEKVPKDYLQGPRSMEDVAAEMP